MIMRNGHKNQWNLIYTDWKHSNFLAALKNSVFDSQTSLPRRIGIENDHMNIKLHAQMRAYCFKPTEVAVFVDVSVALMSQRLVKSAEELKLIEAACKIANRGCEALLQTARIGRSEGDIALQASGKIQEQIALLFPWTELRDTWVWMQSGVNTDGAHNALTSKKLEHCDLLSFNCFPMVDGYYVAIERTGLIVNANLLYLEYCKKEVTSCATQDWKRILCANNFELLRKTCPTIDWILYYWKINIEVFEKGRSMLVAGVVVGDVAKQLNKIYEKYGVLGYRTFGYGHSFGILCHYYGRELILEIREDNSTVLKPGMIISMEPHITVPQGLPGAGGYREHDILLITERGNRNLTNFKYGPEEMIIFSESG
jgi:creatinase